MPTECRVLVTARFREKIYLFRRFATGEMARVCMRDRLPRALHLVAHLSARPVLELRATAREGAAIFMRASGMPIGQRISGAEMGAYKQAAPRAAAANYAAR